jgi:ABC-type transporter Mla maintaining outer membrane lipid asymmetry ATPase subunit MlaF
MITVNDISSTVWELLFIAINENDELPLMGKNGTGSQLLKIIASRQNKPKSTGNILLKGCGGLFASAFVATDGATVMGFWHLGYFGMKADIDESTSN